jgi:hypothetical protein
MARLGSQCVLDRVAVTEPPRLKRWLHRIDIPTLLLWGTEDRIVTPAYGEGWREAIPGAGSRSFRRPATSRIWSSPKRSSNASGLRRQSQLAETEAQAALERQKRAKERRGYRQHSSGRLR